MSRDKLRVFVSRSNGPHDNGMATAGAVGTTSIALTFQGK